MRNIVVFLLLILPNIYGQTLWNGQGHIPQSSQVKWTNAGLLPNTPTVADNFFDVTNYGAVPNDGQNDFDAVQQAIMDARSAPGLSIIYFPPGTYDIHSRIELTHLDNNIVFQGAGSNHTTLKFNVGHTTQCFYIHGHQTSTLVNAILAIPKGSKDFYGDNMGSVQTGDWIRLSEYHHGVHSSWAYGSIGQITQLVNVQGNHGTMKDEASKSYSYANGTRFWKIVPVQNVGIEKLRIYRADAGHDVEGTNVLFKYAVNCWVRGVESEYTSRHHIDIWYSSHIYVSGCYFHQARDYGDAGRGYGVVLNFSTTNCLIENNIFRKLRHSMLLQAGANCNVFAYNYSREPHGINNLGVAYAPHDLVLHGNYPYANLLEHNYIEQIRADDSHGSNGPYNALVRNYVKEKAIRLQNSPQTSLVGNQIFYTLALSGNTSLSIDIYCKWPQGSGGYPNWQSIPHSTYIFNNTWLNLNGVLLDTSYYYSDMPSFLSLAYTFPSIGPRKVAYSQNIPAKDRYSNPIKTYVSNPTTIPPPVIAGFTQTPMPIYKGGQGTVKCNLSQGIGNISYNWTEHNVPAGVNVSFSGNKATISYSGGMGIASTVGNNPRAPVFLLECTASNSAGSSTASYMPILAEPPGGCPFVYTWNGEVFVEDNNILPQSQYPENIGNDVTDFYHMFTQPALEEDEQRYRLGIGEFEQEQTFLDQVQLWVVDHEPGTFITVDDSGAIIQFLNPALFVDAQLDSEDVLKYLQEQDSIIVEVQEGETLELTFSRDGGGEFEEGLLIIGHTYVAKENIAGYITQGDKERGITFKVFRFRRNPSYSWVLVSSADTSLVQLNIE